MERKSEAPDLEMIAWEVTRRCMMDCKHCRAGEKPSSAEHELTTKECFTLIDDITSFSSPIIYITGGEPMFRKDLPDIVEYVTKKGIGITLSPCGPQVNEEKLAALKDAGLEWMSFSIDGIDADSHDSFRRYPGAFKSVMKGIEAAKKVGIGFAIFTTVTSHNVNDLPRILKFASNLGASLFSPFFLVPVGKGQSLRHRQISPAKYEKCLNWLYDVCEGKQRFTMGGDMWIRPGCAPHFYRIHHQRQCKYKFEFFNTTYKDGCLAGISFLFISHTGKVQPCGYLELACGDVRENALKNCWESSDVFLKLRCLDAYRGKCGYCEFLSVCRGCRARAFAELDDYMEEDPFCNYQPKMKKRDLSREMA